VGFSTLARIDIQDERRTYDANGRLIGRHTDRLLNRTFFGNRWLDEFRHRGGSKANGESDRRGSEVCGQRSYDAMQPMRPLFLFLSAYLVLALFDFSRNVEAKYTK